MRIGIISEGYGDESMELLSDCDEVEVLKAGDVTTDQFHRVVTSHLDDDLVIPSVAAIGLQLVQLLPSFKVLANENKIIYFIQKDRSALLSDEIFFEELYHLALVEEMIIKRRTVASIRKAQEKGIVLGRPKIDRHLIKKIQKLHSLEKKTIREIATICNVSIGTAFKYAKE